MAEFLGILGERLKRALGDFLSQAGVAQDSERGGIDQIHVAMRQFSKGFIRVCLRVVA